MTATRQDLGCRAEEIASNRLRGYGWTIVARNVRVAALRGELDLIGLDGDALVFVEVKTRAGSSFGGGYEAVGWQKQRKLRQLGEAFAAAHGRPGTTYRFDVASVTSGLGGPPDVHVFEDAF